MIDVETLSVIVTLCASLGPALVTASVYWIVWPADGVAVLQVFTIDRSALPVTVVLIAELLLVLSGSETGLVTDAVFGIDVVTFASTLALMRTTVVDPLARVPSVRVPVQVVQVARLSVEYWAPDR